MSQSITFLRSWRGRAVGHIDTRLNLGVMTTLVQCGTARWTETKADTSATQQQRERKRR